MFTIDEIVREIRRELRLRLRVYSRMVETGSMDEAEAQRRIGIMEDILAHYTELAGGDRQGELRL
jgi:hypothetical protein